MKKNVGSIDKFVRIIIAIVAFWAAYTGKVESPVSYILYALGAIMILTTVMGSCPIYSVIGVNTCKIKE
jgi:hypothetical protein